MRTGRVLAALLAAATVSAAAAASGAAGATTTPSSSGTNVLVVMNPSKHAITNEVRHVKDAFGLVSTLPELWFFGIYEQHSSDDGAPFDQPFVFTETPAAAARPTLEPPDPCHETGGTSYQNGECKTKHDKTRNENVQRLSAWRDNYRGVLARWQRQTLGQIDKAGRRTEESKRWDLSGALARAGTDLESISPGGSRQNCLLLLGDLAVQRPPSGLDLAPLKDTKIIVTGHRSTQQVEDMWKERLPSIEFLPADVTDFILKDAVMRCTSPAS
jgi:hypothetical protein